jgi:hypothetical protein
MSRQSTTQQSREPRFYYERTAQATPPEIQSEFINDLDRIRAKVASLNNFVVNNYYQPNGLDSIHKEVIQLRNYLFWLIEEYQTVGTPQFLSYVSDFKVLLPYINLMAQYIQSNATNPDRQAILNELEFMIYIIHRRIDQINIKYFGNRRRTAIRLDQS